MNKDVSVRVGILGNRDSWYVSDLSRALSDRGHQSVRLEFRTLTAAEGILFRRTFEMCGETTDSQSVPLVSSHLHDDDGRIDIPFYGDDLTTLDAILVRTMPPGSLEQVVFRMDVLARLEETGVKVINPPKVIECAVDKYLATTKLARAGLPVPETIVCQDADSAMLAFESLGGDVVVKPLFGSEGRGIVRVSDPDLAFRTFRTLERIQSVLYLQRFIEHEGFDVRVLILGGHVVGAMKRRSGSDFRTNVARSAVGEPHTLTDSEVQLAQTAVTATGACFAGVDLLYDRSGECYVLEVNAVPGWRAFQRVTGTDVAARLVLWLEQKT